jgi:hypothetical protein
MAIHAAALLGRRLDARPFGVTASILSVRGLVAFAVERKPVFLVALLGPQPRVLRDSQRQVDCDARGAIEDRYRRRAGVAV